MSQQAHAFRGEFIDVCAQVELWALSIIERVDKGVKAPHLFGQKLGRIEEIAKQGEVFCKPARVRDLLEKFKPLAELRSRLAHAVAQTPSQGADPIFAWEVAGPCGTRFWLRQSEMIRLLIDLKKLRKELADQKLISPAATTPPGRSAPPCSRSSTDRAADISAPSRS